MSKQENLFSEFILSKIEDKYNSKIEICNCENFTIIKGETESEEVLSIQKISEEFSKKNPEFEVKNTIDLLNYKSTLDFVSYYEFVFYKNESPKSIDSNYFTLSNFPYGYSWNEGKTLYFYFKHITNMIPSSYPFNWIEYKISLSKDGRIDFDISDDYINNQDDILKSVILDLFDFNLTEFLSEAKKMDLEQMILNPNYNDPLLTKVVDDFIIT